MNITNIALLDDEIIQQRVVAVWEKVFFASNAVIVHAKKFGFVDMIIKPNPNIHQLLTPIRMLDALIDTFISDSAMEYDEKRLMLNAKKQLTNMELVAAALTADNREDFDIAITELENQAPF